MSKTFVIAEAACTWLHASLEGAFRSIRAAKECGADAWKTQWCSDPEAMAMRRGVARDKYTRLGWAGDVLPRLKEECERVGIEFMCTVFLPKDIPLIAPYVSRFKVSAFEAASEWVKTDKKDYFTGKKELQNEFILAHRGYGKNVIISDNFEGTDFARLISKYRGKGLAYQDVAMDVSILRCVSKYPTSPEDLHLTKLWWDPDMEGSNPQFDGLSDHTTSVLTGAVAVGAGARIIEKHVRLSDTPSSDPDYGHSLVLDGAECRTSEGEQQCALETGDFSTYVWMVRQAERML